MDIKEIRDKKRAVEEKIKDLIGEFYDETNVGIEGIEINILKHIGLNGSGRVVLSVQLKLESI